MFFAQSQWVAVKKRKYNKRIICSSWHVLNCWKVGARIKNKALCCICMRILSWSSTVLLPKWEYLQLNLDYYIIRKSCSLPCCDFCFFGLLVEWTACICECSSHFCYVITVSSFLSEKRANAEHTSQWWHCMVMTEQLLSNDERSL